LPRNEEIRAAIAAYNDADDGLLLPPDAGSLLALMFPRDTIFRGSVKSLLTGGFDEGTVRKLLKSLTEAGFLSKEPWHRRGTVGTYRLHLPPRRQP
jgi:hypothetical protein